MRKSGPRKKNSKTPISIAGPRGQLVEDENMQFQRSDKLLNRKNLKPIKVFGRPGLIVDELSLG